jgi:hypothetical protein
MGDSQQVNNLLQQLARQTASLAQVQAEWERRQSATPRSLRVRLGDANYEVRLEALEELAEALGNEDLSLGDTTIIARRLREEGSLARLALLVQDDSNEVLTRALYCLGNLCSDSFDTASRETKKLLFERDGSGARARLHALGRCVARAQLVDAARRGAARRAGQASAYARGGPGRAAGGSRGREARRRRRRALLL